MCAVIGACNLWGRHKEVRSQVVLGCGELLVLRVLSMITTDYKCQKPAIKTSYYRGNRVLGESRKWDYLNSESYAA